MQIEKNGKIYIVKENLTAWMLAIQIGRVPVQYTVKKSDCPTFDELKKFVNENDTF